MTAPPEASSSSDPALANLTVHWKWVSLTLAIIALTAIGVLSVIVGTNDVDTLSTIALALAVLAFAAQLIVSLAQGMAGAQQLAQAERVNADTQAALAALRATSDAMLATQREHFGQVLQAALNRAVPAAVNDLAANKAGRVGEKATEQTEELQEAILARLDEYFARRFGSPGTAPAGRTLNSVSWRAPSLANPSWRLEAEDSLPVSLRGDTGAAPPTLQ
ncbi:hypothetical protein ACIBF5_15830 [Micromonospora sp. NPDC050417]|uniref:hypothetical protein n=1 Tax=Micromonospora sp. NPDC050417 TaxID=3364280 RepID=UPI0037BB772C